MAKTSKLLTTLQERMDWKIGGKSAVGQVGDYWFTVTQRGGIEPVLVTTMFSNTDTDSLEKLKSAFMAEKKKYKLAKAIVEDNSIHFTVNPDTVVEKMFENVTDLIENLVKYFAENSLKPGCKVCGENVALYPVKISEYSYGICDSCQRQAQQELEEISYNNELQGNYFTGIIGAMLGALIGALLWMGVSYVGFYASIIGFVMAYLAHKGYELFKGRIGKGMPIIVAVSVILGIIFANILEIALGLTLDPETGLTFFEALQFAVQALYNTEYFYVGQVWGGIAIGLLFAVMGSYRKIKEIYETTKPEHYSVERL